jgi:hypothetical protein
VKYRPLDLSMISAQNSLEGNSIRNTAAMIMANAGWSKQSQATLKEIARYNKSQEAVRSQTFLSSFFDALSTPLYGVANALDESIAGHDSDRNDSVIEDIGKTVGGIFTGGIKGVGAGLRGATGMLDVLPGVDINDEWQSDPTDKTRFSDVNIRLATGMSSKDAQNPENWDRALTEARKEKAELPGALGDFFYGDLNQGSNDANMQTLLKRLGIIGIAEDIGGDPLNFVSFGGKGAANATKGIIEGLDAARSSESTAKSITDALKFKNKLEFEPKAKIDPGYAPPVGALDEIAPGTSVNIPSTPNLLPPHPTRSNIKTLSNIGRRETPAQGVELAYKDQRELVKKISTAAGRGEKNWLYLAADLLRAHPQIQWTRTEKFLQTADRAIKAKGLRHDPARMAPVLAKHITDDVAAARTTGQIERRLMNQKTDISIARDAPKMKRSEAALANKVVHKFEREILGGARAPGTGEGLAKAIAEGRNVRYSGPQQARMWNQITSSLKYSDARKFDKAVRILRTVEEYFITKGMIPHSAAKTAESVPLRLSQVAEAIGPQFLGKSHAFITGILRGDPKALAQLDETQIAALQALRAEEAIAAAPAVQKGLDAADNIAKNFVQAPISVARKNSLIPGEIKDLRRFVAANGGGDVGAHVAGQYLGNILGKGDAVNAALNSNRLKTEAWLSKVGRPGVRHFLVNEPDFVKAVTNSIAKAADLPNPAQLGKLIGPAARVKDWLGARFNAAYGVRDMRQIYLTEQGSAMATIGRRANLMNNLGRRFDPNDTDLWHEAFRTAQKNGIADGRVAELQSEIAKTMENLFGGSGLRDGAIADATVVGRSRLLLDELNANLRRFGLGQYQFTAKKNFQAADGTIHDFSNGLDWMKSWEAWNVTKPYEFLHRVQNAVEHTVREKNMFDEIITRFGSPAKFGNVKYGVSHPRLAGYFFTEEAARQARVFVRMLEEVSTPNSKALQHFDHVLSKLKASMTIYIPGHHWTNLIGDTYYNWIAGVNKPVRYEQAMKTMLAQKGRYGEFAQIGKPNANSFEALTGPKALEQAIARSMVIPDAGLAIPAKGNQVIVTMQNGTKVTADMIYTAALKEGILPSARVLEDVTSDVSTVLDKFKPLGGKGQRAAHQISEIRDHIPRLAQYIDGIAKSKGSFTAASASSARSVRKWHPDGLDLTKFERNFMKRVFPFYSWTRKAIPLAIESAIFASPKVMAYPRLMEFIALSNGVEPNGPSDAFPNDQLFPDWLRARGIGPVIGGAGDYTVVNPSTPVLDIMTMLGQPGTSGIDFMNPIMKVPIETMQGQTLGRNVPIDNYSDYFAKQIPVVSHAGRASGQFGVSDSTKAEGFPNWTNVLNMLTGAKMVDTGKYQKSGQFDVREYLRKAAEQQGR